MTRSLASVGSALTARSSAALRKPAAQVVTVMDAAAIALASGVLYVATLAPTVVWGDDATLQRAAISGELHASAGSHPTWVVLAHLMSRLPLGEPAYRVNLSSAFAGAVAVALVYLWLRTLGISRIASLLATAALAVSHTFWAHTVRPEVYALAVATLALLLWATTRWYRAEKPVALIAMGLTTGLALSTHVLALLYLPAIVWVVLSAGRPGRIKDLLTLAASSLLALVPLGYLLWRDSQQYDFGPVSAIRWALFSFNGYDFAGRFFSFSRTTIATDLMQWLLFLGFQFVGLALILGLVGAVAFWNRLPARLAVFVLLLFGVPVFFAFAYDVGDRYVFFLPSYVAFSAWIGAGTDMLLTRVRQPAEGSGRVLLVAGLLTVLLVTPVLTYRLVPTVMGRLGLRFREDRVVPGPQGQYFVLWPPKNGYTDARDFAAAALASAPLNGLLLADPILASPMQYLQEVEKLRPDVMVRFCCWDIDVALAAAGTRPMALADIVPSIYPIENLQQAYRLEPHPPIYWLQPLAAAP